jgi:protein-tyrosine phosphatase
MTPYWIDSGGELRIAIVPRPRGGDWLEDELKAIRRADVDVLVSMLTTEEQKELGLEEEAELSEQAGLRFLRFPIPDRTTPEERRAFQSFLNRIQDEVADGKSVAVHCRASIGRSSVLLASLLCLHHWKPREAFEAISRARGVQVPDTPEQIRWVERFAETLREPFSAEVWHA